MPTNSRTGGNQENPFITITGNIASPQQEKGKAPSGYWPEGGFLPPETSPIPFREQRLAYFRTNYDFMTGVRIAGTLGGFFLVVLLTLLYKSKCKKSSPIPSPRLSMEGIGQNVLLRPANEGESLEMRLLLIDGGPRPWDRPELLFTSPIELSESSIESESPPYCSQEQNLQLPGNRVKRKRKCGHSHTSTAFLNQPIDIHIIQPTPSISPSNSEMFPRKTQKESYWKKERSPTHQRASDSEVISPLLLYLHAENLKFADDTSSENLPVRGSDEEAESPSIGSDSVFTFNRDRRRSSVSAYTGLEEDDENCGMTLSTATAQVHNRDSFCSSEVEWSDYMEGRKRRSSSTQTTISDLRKSMGMGVTTPHTLERTFPINDPKSPSSPQPVFRRDSGSIPKAGNTMEVPILFQPEKYQSPMRKEPRH